MKIAIVIHVFYLEVFQDVIIPYIKKLNISVDIYITTPHEFDNSYKEKFHYKAIEKTENLGMDVLPFIYVTSKYKLWNYDLVIKVHTKNNMNSKSIDMMRIYLDSLLTDHALSIISLSMNSDSDIGLWGPLVFARYVDKLMYRNRDKINLLKKILESYSSFKNVIFFAGTMFAIRGFLLKNLSLQYDRIKHLMIIENATQESSGDGSYAHALERLFSLLVKSQSYNIGIINPKEFSQKNIYTIFSDKAYASKQYKQIFQRGSNETSCRWINLSEYIKLDYSKIIDFNQYSKILDLKKEWNLNLTAHYLFFGDYLKESKFFENNFSSSLYQIIRKDVFRAGIPSAYHYLSRGKKERPTLFTQVMCQELIHQFFPNKFNWENFNDQENNTNFRKYFIKMGDIEVITEPQTNNSFHINFESQTLSTLELIEFYIPEIILNREILKLQIDHEDFIGAKLTVENISSKKILTTDIVEILAVCYTLDHEWELAYEYWNIYQQSKINPHLFLSVTSARLINYDNHYDPINVFKHKTTFCNINKDSNKKTFNSNVKISIYTSLFGDYDDLPLLETYIPEEIDLIAFTDHERLNAHPRWKQIICKPDSSSDNLSAKRYKVLPHHYLKEYSHSLFVDANTVFTGNIDDLMIMLLESGKFTMWRHPFRKDLFKEACIILQSSRAKPQIVIDQLKSYVASSIPQNTGLCEGSFIWREHFNVSVVNFMEEWWKHINQYSHRDQLSLCFLMWYNNFYPKIIDDELGNSRKNIFFYKTLHKVEVKTR